jgi:hypothetical protein
MKTNMDEIFDKLSKSKFRGRFALRGRELAYARVHGMETVETHARDLLRTRLFVAEPRNDGKQTPFRGHPVFIAQHATATCCRGCLAKWHGIEVKHALASEEEDYVVAVIMEWIRRQMLQDG